MGFYDNATNLKSQGLRFEEQGDEVDFETSVVEELQKRGDRYGKERNREQAGDEFELFGIRIEENQFEIRENVGENRPCHFEDDTNVRREDCGL